MRNRYNYGILTNSGPHLYSMDTGGSREQGADSPPVSGYMPRDEHAAASAAAGSIASLFSTTPTYSSAYLKRRELINRQQGQTAWNEAEKLAFEADWYDNQLEWIATIDQTYGEPVFWDVLAAMAPPFPRGEQGPKEKLAEENLAAFQPTRIQKLLKQDAMIREELERQVQLAREEDRKDYLAWKAANDFAHDILDGNRTAYLRVLEEMAPLQELTMLGSGLEFSVRSSSEVEVELDVNSQQVIPREAKVRTEAGVASPELTVPERNDLELKYICGSVLRIAGELFALLPLESVVVQARDTKLNGKTGQEEYITVLSIRIERKFFAGYHAGRERCLEALMHCSHRMEYDPGTGFEPVDDLL
ncbi:hypothetical protein [Paenibacillus cellulositrophicus]|uniref:hypothetical protein n=1 Tax=Paenibacillus cellulositrophicus TaxID=562959 RepID=UPI0012671660|nr:hypothetical protein [Paenibacillus cellulositrophicus]